MNFGVVEIVSLCLFERLERAADIFICTPVGRAKQLPCTVCESTTQSGRLCSGALWTESNLWSHSDWSCAQDAGHVRRSVWTRLSASHRALQSGFVMTPLSCTLFCMSILRLFCWTCSCYRTTEMNSAKARSCFYKLFVMHGQKVTEKGCADEWQMHMHTHTHTEPPLAGLPFYCLLLVILQEIFWG